MAKRFYRPFLIKTLDRFLEHRVKAKPFMTFDPEVGRMVTGTKSTHRSRSGVKFNRLIRTNRRISPRE